MILRLGIKWMAASMLMILSAVAAHATEGVVVGDAYVNSAHPSVNYGSLSNLYVNSNGTALIQFDLSALPSGTTASQIGSATLKLYVNRVNTSGLVSVQPVAGAWSESTVTYATLPSLDSTVASFTPATAGQFIVIDMTSLVQSWLTTPSSNYGIALSTTSGDVSFDSKENDETGHAAPTTLAFVCASTCSEFAPQMIVPIAFLGGGISPPYTGGYAQVQDAPYTGAISLIGIATGPDTGVVGGDGILSQTVYTAGQTVQVAVTGIAYCEFDSQVVAGDFVTLSQYNSGFCNSAGANYPSSAIGGSHPLLGIALAANGSGDFGYPFAIPVLHNAAGAVQ